MSVETKKPQEKEPEFSQALVDAVTAAVKGDVTPLVSQFFVIRDEAQKYVKLNYNRVQQHYEASESKRNVIVKPRKIGFTTRWLAVALANATVTPGYEALGLTYDDEEAEYMFNIVRRFHDMLPKEAQLELGKDTGRAMSFPRLDSRIEIQTAGGRRKGRGRTPSTVLLDEFAQYEENAAEEIFGSIVNSAPMSVPVTIQSTPKGIGNPFHALFSRALRGESPFKPHFYPWMWLPEKHRLAPGSPLALPADQGSLELTDDESTLLAEWNSQHPDCLLSEDNIRWRRYKKAENQELFGQEYPEDPVSCFLSTTDTVFETVQLLPWLQRVRAPLEKDRKGTLLTWKRPQPGVAYCAGVDCGEGIVGRDNSVAVLGTTNGEVVAVLAGIYDQTEMAQLVYDLAGRYNQAFVLNERQAGFTFQLTLHNLGYKNLYRHRDVETPRSRSMPQLGFPTTQASKRQLIEGMRAALKGDAFQCPDIATLSELVEFKRHKDGTYGAPLGGHDDRAMAAMLYLQAIQACERAAPRVMRALGRRNAVLAYPVGAMP